MMLIVITHNPLIRHDDDSGRWIKRMRQFFERNVAEPFTIVRRAVVRQATISRSSDGNLACAVIADMSVDVGVSKILRWTTVTAQGNNKVVPIARAVNGEKRVEIDDLRVESGPAQCESD